MNTYLAFIDESGDYKTERSASFSETFPYYIKSCLVIPANKYRLLFKNRKNMCDKYGINTLGELKWNHLWKLRKRDVFKKSISYKANEEYLKDIPYKKAELYILDMIGKLEEYDPFLVYTITPNCVFEDKVSELNIEIFHLRNIMQRIEMELGDKSGDNFAILFADQLEEKSKERLLKEAYHDIYYKGDFIKEYTHIYDTLSYSYSHHSCGIQMADFMAGILSGYLRGYEFSKDIFSLKVYSKIRKGYSSLPFGYGIIVVPNRPKSRLHVIERFSGLI